ncbi:MAG: hypothetical protein WAZ12_00100 [Candidatus Absconditicoccaceae bacterium]
MVNTIKTEKTDGLEETGVEQTFLTNEVANVLKDNLLEDRTSDLEKAGYLSDLDGQKINFLDVEEYDKETIFNKLQTQDLPAGVVKHLNYNTPKAKKLKIVMLRFDREKNEKLKPEEQLSESNYIEKMKEFGVRPIKFEEYLQFVSNNEKFLKDQKGYIYMPEKVVSSERYTGRIQSHHHGIGIDIGQGMFYARFPFVIEE